MVHPRREGRTPGPLDCVSSAVAGKIFWNVLVVVIVPEALPPWLVTGTGVVTTGVPESARPAPASRASTSAEASPRLITDLASALLGRDPRSRRRWSGTGSRAGTARGLGSARSWH